MTARRPYPPRTFSGPMARLTFSYTGVRVRDLDRSIDFYTRVLGMKLQFRFRLKKTRGAIALLKSPRGRQRLELNWYEPGSRFGTPYRRGSELDHLAFRTPDLREALRDARRLGAKVVQGPIRVGRDSWAYVEDPDGIWIEIVGPLKGA